MVVMIARYLLHLFSRLLGRKMHYFYVYFTSIPMQISFIVSDNYAAPNFANLPCQFLKFWFCILDAPQNGNFRVNVEDLCDNCILFP